MNHKQLSQDHPFSQLITKYSSIFLYNNNINVCNRSQRKLVLVSSQTFLWLMKDTFSLWSITNMSVIDNGTFDNAGRKKWHFNDFTYPRWRLVCTWPSLPDQRLRSPFGQPALFRFCYKDTLYCQVTVIKSLALLLHFLFYVHCIVLN